MNALTRILLTGLAGYCDTVTFVHMKGVFSAHVTGNFVLFAAALARGLRPEDYLKLLTFPVFVLAVAAAAVLMVVRGRRGRVTASHVLLPMALILAFGTGLAATDYPGRDEVVTLLVVFALGMQNALNPFIPGPMTTVMTGTVTNTVVALTRRLMGDAAPAAASAGTHTPVLIAVFATGCLVAAWAVTAFDYLSLGLPAALALGLSLLERPAKEIRRG